MCYGSFESFLVIPTVLMTTDLIRTDGRDVLCRGSETCGDIDVMITRSVEDGKTHVGGCLYPHGCDVLYGSWNCDLSSMDPVALNRCCEEIMAGVPRAGDHHG